MKVHVIKNEKESNERCISRFNKKVQASRKIFEIKKKRYHKKSATKTQTRASAVMRDKYRAAKEKNKFYQLKVKELLKVASAFLNDGQTSLLDCELLLAYVLGVDKEYLISNSDLEVEEDLKNLFDKYIARIKEGEPIAYITGEKEFFGVNFFVDNRVLIPRPETEMLVELIINFIDNCSDEERKFKVLDIGTGSSNIPVALLKYFEEKSVDRIDRVDALEFDENALEVARINIEQYGLEDKINLFQSDLLEVVNEREDYDVIVANLPYIGEVKNRFVSDATEKFEPRVALFGGDTGLELYERTFQEIRSKGIIFDIMIGEFGFAQSEAMEELLSEYFNNFEIVKDLAGIDRIFMVKSN